MSILIDTPIWSLALRRPAERLSSEERRHVAEWTELVREHRVLLIGLVRQEVLSGIRDTRTFERLLTALRGFPDVPPFTRRLRGSSPGRKHLPCSRRRRLDG
jgi:hypothetical protein